VPVAKKASSRRTAKKTVAAPPAAEATASDATAAGATTADATTADATTADATITPTKRPARKRTSKTTVADPFAANATDGPSPSPSTSTSTGTSTGTEAAAASSVSSAVEPRPAIAPPIFQAPDPTASQGQATAATEPGQGNASDEASGGPDDQQGSDAATSTSSRRRRSRGGRNRRKSSNSASAESAGVEEADQVPGSSEAPTDAAASALSSEGTAAADGATAASALPAAKTASSAKKSSKSTKSSSTKSSSAKSSAQSASEGAPAEATDESTPAAEGDAKDSDEGTPTSSSSRRRRRRRRSGDSSDEGSGDAGETTTKTREPRPPSDKITSVEGSTRIEAKKQRRREGREAGRRRAPILSESEFLARRESVDRVMVIRQRDDVTQIAVLEDNVLVEHYVALEQQSSLIGNVYLGRVQNVLPSMEAAFIDIGKGRNAVLYAGEVNWDLIGDRNQPRRIENALKSGQQILVQVSKDPVGHKGARLTSQISLPGRYLVYVPGGGSSGISRKLPDTERNRLKNLLKDILPDESGVIIRTAAEGASEAELTRDVRRLTSRWEEIEKLVKNGKAPALLYAEPDITLKVVRDLFTEDFAKLVVSGEQAWETVNEYVSYVAPDLTQRLERYDGKGDVFDNYRVDEQIAKALERKVWLPSGGSLVIDRTEAMTVVDVNTGKFTGSGGNLEQTVTKNNLEAAEEIVRQLRLRDIGGIIVIDFIDMVLENNRDLVLRRLVECLGRDRTRHQVAEVTSLGLVQMTRKRIGTGLVESFSVPCEVCHGRGVIIETEPVKGKSEESASSSSTGRTSSKRSSRQRSAKPEPEVEQVDPQAAERHSAAAAATAAIAAALHPESRPDSESTVSGHAETTGSDAFGHAGTPGVEVSGHAGNASATGAPAKSAAAKRSPTKRTSTKKAAATSAAARDEQSTDVPAESAPASTAKKAPAKRAATKKAATKSAATKSARAKTATAKKVSANEATASKSTSKRASATKVAASTGEPVVLP
jgi:ribonuclease E